jgi:hypothetical protein
LDEEKEKAEIPNTTATSSEAGNEKMSGVRWGV